MLLVVQLLLSASVVYGAVALAATGTPAALVGLLPVALAVIPWWRDAGLVAFDLAAVVVLLPLVAVHLVPLGLFRLLELLVRELIDRPFLDRSPGPVLNPTLGPPPSGAAPPIE